MILVTAANGNQGKLLVPKLIAAGVPVRCSVRSEASAQALRALGVKEVLVGEINDPGLMAEALDGVQKVYYVGPTAHRQERELGLAIVDAAVKANVEHFVFSSVLHAISTGLFQHEYKRDVEERLVASGLNYTILQPANFMVTFELLPAFRNRVFKQGWALDKRMSMVDLDDITDVALDVLVNGGEHLGATYELCSAGWLTGHDVGDAISRATGKPIAVEEISADDWVKVWFGDIDLDTIPSEARMLRQISKFYSEHDHVGSANVLRWLLKREPATIEEFARKHYAVFQAGQADALSRAL